MTHEQLTQPRYEVVADYPNSPYYTGQILHTPTEEAANYPNIFRLMKWWEQRELEDMPNYVKGKLLSNDPVGVFMVYWKKKGGEWLLKKEGYKIYSWFSDCNLSPATETEYLNYLKSNQ